MSVRASLVVEGRIATLGGAEGFGWVQAIAIADGRVIAAGDRDQVEPVVGPGTKRLILGPSEAVIPGLTDAHLHLAGAAASADQVDLEGETSADAGLRRIGVAHRALERDRWLLGHGWESEIGRAHV